MILKNVGTTFRAAVAIMAISLFTLVSDATAQVFCGTTWTTACASVTVRVVEVVEGGEFSDKTAANYVLVISVYNTSFNPDPLSDPNLDVEASVIRQLLFRVTDGEGNSRFPTVAFWVTDENGDLWSEWELSRDEEFIKIGAGFTQDVTNNDGSCRGIVTTTAYADPENNLPCEGNTKRDHRTLAVFHLAFDVEPLVLEDWAAQLVNIDASSCPDGDPYCESDWAVIPEPVTMVLVGTGLAGIGLMRRRRRRGLDIVED